MDSEATFRHFCSEQIFPLKSGEKMQLLALICPTARLAARPHFDRYGLNFKGLAGDVGTMSGETFGQIG